MENMQIESRDTDHKRAREEDNGLNANHSTFTTEPPESRHVKFASIRAKTNYLARAAESINLGGNHRHLCV